MGQTMIRHTTGDRRVTLRLARLLAALTAWGVLGFPAFAQEATPLTEEEATTVGAQAGDTLGTYIVRPGDTLKGITTRFLGNDELWRENWRLNSNLRDPNLLIPGQQLRIILDRQLPPRTVQVTSVARRVDQKPNPNPWTGAEIGDLLQEDDGLRTGEKASAEVLFDNETKLQLTEESLIFLRRVGSTIRGVPQETVEIVQGHADLTARASSRDAVDIEIIMGETTAKPTAGAGGLIETRARQDDSGAGAVMVYSGASSVEAGGAEVAVAQGMGTTVPMGAPPSPPERLLPAARTIGPESGSTWGYSNLLFSWRPVPGTASYVVEVCGDAACSALVDRQVDVTDANWTSAQLPVGDHYWRVTAIAPSGLDGYPSDTVPFSVLSNREDEAPPVVAAIILGTPSFDSERAVVGDAASILLDARDDASGVASVEYKWDEGPWQSWTGGTISIPSGSGVHRLETRATDRLGRVSQVFSSTIDRFGETPAPPDVFASPSLNAEPPSTMSF